MSNRIDRTTLSEEHLRVLLHARRDGGFALDEIRPEVWEAVFCIAMATSLKARYRLGALRLIADRTDPVNRPVSGATVTEVHIGLSATVEAKEINGGPETRALPHSNGVQIRLSGDPA